MPTTTCSRRWPWPAGSAWHRLCRPKGGGGMNGRIAALCGRVPELTAAQLDGMDAAALAALYSSGVRLLTVKNNDTITLHAVDPMGRLVWLDSNMPKNNCFDNTNFISPINQRGQSSYSTTWGMAIVSWVFWISTKRYYVAYWQWHYFGRGKWRLPLYPNQNRNT